MTQDLSDYAAREASSPALSAFSGGDAGGTLLFILLIGLLAAGIYYLVQQADR